MEFKQLIEALRNPAAYAHPVPEVEVVETHISAVLLAGDYAYKIKKPVDFGFVDFTTLDKRKRYCEEELRLNRRFARQWYLDVVAVRGNGSPPSFTGEGAVTEYAVRMKRFDDAALVDRCIDRGDQVNAAMIESFAGDVAAVHDDAAAAAPSDGYATPAVIAANVRECREPIEKAGLIDAQSELLDGMDGRAAALEPWFKRRLAAGRVRECHGDLHLGNLFLDGGRITAFDCIEFNPRLRWIDVANEIAFFTMDLHYHGRSGYARRFRNAYLDATGDDSLLRVLRYYEVYRALVRAKVASLREAEQAGTGLEDARRHLALGDRLMRESPRPVLIITCGLSGSGKTHNTTRLVESSEAIRIRSDIERDRSPAADVERYSDAGIERVYERMLERAAEIIRAGYPAIVDATFLKRSRRERFYELARSLDVPFKVLHCTAAEAELRRRIEKRQSAGTDASEADLSVLDQQLGQLEPFDASERGLVVDYDTERGITLAELLRKLGVE